MIPHVYDAWHFEGRWKAVDDLHPVPLNNSIQWFNHEQVALQKGTTDCKTPGHGVASPLGRPITSLDVNICALDYPVVPIGIHVHARPSPVLHPHLPVKGNNVGVTPQDALSTLFYNLHALGTIDA
eukprot:6481064-Amphidinium_carterae.1